MFSKPTELPEKASMDGSDAWGIDTSFGTQAGTSILRSIGRSLTDVEYENESTKTPDTSKMERVSMSLLRVILVSGRKKRRGVVEEAESVGKEKAFPDASTIRYPESGVGTQAVSETEKYSSVASSEVFGSTSDT